MLLRVTYRIEPELVDSFTHLLGTLELNAEFTTVLIDWIFPLWSDTVLEHKAVGANVQTSGSDDIAPRAIIQAMNISATA